MMALIFIILNPLLVQRAVLCITDLDSECLVVPRAEHCKRSFKISSNVPFF